MNLPKLSASVFVVLFCLVSHAAAQEADCVGGVCRQVVTRAVTVVDAANDVAKAKVKTVAVSAQAVAAPVRPKALLGRLRALVRR